MKPMMSKIALATSAALLAACTTPVMHQVEKEHGATGKEAKTVIEAAKAAGSIEYVTKSSELYFAGKSFTIKDEELPASFKKRVTLFRDLDGMQALLDRITALSGIRVQYTRTANAAAPNGQASTVNALGQFSAATNPLMAGMPSPQTFTLNYDGTLEGLFNYITTKYGYYWRYKDGVVQLFETDTRTFEMIPMAGSTAMDNSIGGDSTSNGQQSEGGAAQTTSSSAKSQMTTATEFNFWGSLVESLKPLMTAKGQVTFSQATGMVTVTDTPDALDKVAVYLEAQNRLLSRQVSISVKVLAVESSDSDNYGINWDVVRSTLRNKFDISLNTGLNNGTLPTMKLGIVSGNFTGTEALIGALSEKHKVSTVTSASAVTLNNYPVPITVGTQRAYLKSVSSTTEAETGAKTYTLEPGLVRFGTTMNFVPKVLADNTVLLQFGLDMTDMVGDFKVFGAGDSQIQLPELSSRTFLQRASLKSGETLILAGFEDSKGMSDRTGVGSADLPILGGSLKGTNRKHTMVIIVQPTVMEVDK